ncbi:MAG: hypothetical protein WDN30_09930 [Pararobbsia sp.]
MRVHHLIELERTVDDRLERAARETLRTNSTAACWRCGSPLVSQMLCALTVTILASISSTGNVVGASLSAP